MKRILPTTLPILAALLATSCSGLYYKTMEAMGYAKRELLVERVEEARESQTEAKEQIQTTFEAFKALTGFDGGELEDRYNALKKEYERSEDRAEEVSSRIGKIEKVATAMFSEWETELGEYSDPGLRAQSEKQKLATEQSYGKVIGAMRQVEQRMPPVLKAFKDRVLMLKHSLNAQAISSLQGDFEAMGTNVEALIVEMQQSIAEADAFIDSIDN